MSIHGVFAAAALPATAPSSVAPVTAPTRGAEIQALLWVFAFTAVSITVLLRTGTFRLRKIVGPDRVPRGGGAGLLLVLIIGLCVWIFSQAFYVTVVTARWQAEGNKGTPNVEHLFTPHDYAVLSTAPPMAAFAALLLGDLFVGARVPSLLGLGLRRANVGALLGVLGILVIGPWVLWSSWASEQLYQRLQFQHPTEHDLLRSLGTARESASQVFIILGATVAAPLFEELLFRGHLQTLLRRGFLLMSKAGRLAMAVAPPPPAVDVPPNPDGAIPYAAAVVSPPLAAELPQVPQTPPPLPAWPSWLAVLLTSLVFMSVHPMWSWPPIFILALGLGYLYERTGNLWATISVHLLFNGLQTLQYLLLVRGH